MDMLSMHLQSCLSTFLPKYFLQNIKNSLVAKRTIHGWTLGRPLDSWVAIADRATVFQQHCKRMQSRAIVTWSIWYITCVVIARATPLVPYHACHSTAQSFQFWIIKVVGTLIFPWVAVTLIKHRGITYGSLITTLFCFMAQMVTNKICIKILNTCTSGISQGPQWVFRSLGLAKASPPPHVPVCSIYIRFSFILYTLNLMINNWYL